MNPSFNTVTWCLVPCHSRISTAPRLTGRFGSTAIGRRAAASLGPLILPNTGQEHHVTVRLPEGREYLEMEVAQAMVLKGTGAIRFEHRNTHSSMAEVTYTHEVS